MRMKIALPLIGFLIAGLVLWTWVPWLDIQSWAASEQRNFQNVMARALKGVQAGDPLAVWILCSATAAYGFFHALGPGHGKVLIGGAALASGATFRRLSVITILSSLAQAATAILLVGALVFLLRMRSGDLAEFTEEWLAPASYLAIAVIGGVLILRGLRSWYKLAKASKVHHGCCGHAHGPSVEDVTTLTSKRDVIALIASIAIRPCTGALFVLVIAARFDAFAVGCLAVVTMGLGTAAFNLTVAASGVAAQRLARLGAQDQNTVQTVSAALHILGGALIVALSLSMLLPLFDLVFAV
ncbi:nickel/cobalt transporter [Planktotalea sp.]|uniref:nickel/cobalt transporter n=1 Tax=Planktotalea sp. TaxID=2029877 RepID=UPI003D6B69E9